MVLFLDSSKNWIFSTLINSQSFLSLTIWDFGCTHNKLPFDQSTLSLPPNDIHPLSILGSNTCLVICLESLLLTKSTPPIQ